jgi:hypothetical protein
MTPVRRLACLALASLLASSPAWGWGGPDMKANLYDPATMSTPEGQAAAARKYWKGTGIKKIQAAGYKKAAIVEFSVEYVVMEKKDWSGRGNFGLLDIAQAASGAGKKRTEIGEELKVRLPGELYELFRERLVTAGFEVKTLDEVRNSAAFAKLTGSGEADTKKSSYSSRGGYNAGSEKKEIYPVDGLINIKMGAFAAAGNMETQAELAHELGVDVLLRAHFRVGLEKGGKPSLESMSWVAVGAGPQAHEGGARTRYSFAQWGQLDAKDGLMGAESAAASVDHKGAKGKVTDVDEAAYEAALKEMFPAFAGMAVSLMDGDGE